MTGPQQSPQGQPQQSPQDGLDDAALATAIAALLATATSAGAVIGALRVRFALTSMAWQALSLILTQVMQSPPPSTGVIGPASARIGSLHAARRAQYVLAAARRITGAMLEASAKGQPAGAAVRAQLDRERRYYAQHQQAMWQRATAAGRVDLAAAEHGDLLGWNTVHDDKTSADCRRADGRNFRATRPPLIGYPGTVHVGCRCYPGPPHPNAPLLAGSGPAYERAV